MEIKESCRQILKEAAGKDAPVFCAMTLGDKQELDPEIQMRYQLAGIIHILAISGVCFLCWVFLIDEKMA